MTTATEIGSWFIAVHEGEGVVALSLIANELVTNTIALELAAELDELIEERPHPRIVLDFTGTNFVNVAMLEILRAFSQKINKLHGKLVGCSIRPEVKAAFLISDLRQHMEIYASLDSAVAAAAA